jgi:hypothetical protein
MHDTFTPVVFNLVTTVTIVLPLTTQQCIRLIDIDVMMFGCFPIHRPDGFVIGTVSFHAGVDAVPSRLYNYIPTDCGSGILHTFSSVAVNNREKCPFQRIQSMNDTTIVGLIDSLLFHVPVSGS